MSHKNSVHSAISIPDQIEKASLYASTVIPEVVFGGKFVDEAKSAWRFNLDQRPAGKALLDTIRPGDHLVCYSIDRLSRNMRDFCNVTHWLMKKGVHIHYVSDQMNTTTAIGKLQMHLRAAMAQFASDLISERTREAKAIKRILHGDAQPVRKERRRWSGSEYTVGLQQREPLSRPTGTIHMYQRCSSINQYTSGLGLEAQEAGIRRYAENLAKQNNCPIGEVYSDNAISAFKVPFAERPAGKRLLETVKPGDDVVIYRLDRLWRNTADASVTSELFRKRGAYLHFVTEGLRTDSSNGLEWISMMAALAELESAFKSRRVKEALDACRAQGRPVGPIQKGFRAEQVENSVKLTYDKKGAEKLARVWVMKNELGWTTTQVNSALCSFDCRDKRQRATLKHLKQQRVDEKLRQVDRMRSVIPDTLWQKTLDAARKYVKRPIAKKYWLDHRWQYPFGITV